MVMMDSISRMVPGVLNNQESGETESFAGNLLEYPQYSRPEEWHGKKVPEVLMSGHHANIEKWRREQSIYRTAKRRPDLLKKADVSKSMFGSSPEEDREFLQLFSFICLLSFDVYLKKQMIEHMVDELASLAAPSDPKKKN